MATHENTLRRAVQWANGYIRDRGTADLGDRSYDDLVDSFYALVEGSGDDEWAE